MCPLTFAVISFVSILFGSILIDTKLEQSKITFMKTGLLQRIYLPYHEHSSNLLKKL